MNRRQKLYANWISQKLIGVLVILASIAFARLLGLIDPNDHNNGFPVFWGAVIGVKLIFTREVLIHIFR